MTVRSPGVTGVQSGLNTSKYKVSGGEAGSASGFAFSVAFWVPSQAVGSSFRAIAGRFGFGPNSGYLLGSNATFSDLRILMIDGAATQQTYTMTFTASMVAKVLVVTGVHTGTQVKCYLAGVDQGTPVAITGYSVPTVTSQICGRDSNSQPPDSCYVIGMATGIGVPTDADVAKHYRQCKKLHKMAPLSGTSIRPTHTWNVQPHGKTATLMDESGSDHMTLTEAGGAMTYKRLLYPKWL